MSPVIEAMPYAAGTVLVLMALAQWHAKSGTR